MTYWRPPFGVAVNRTVPSPWMTVPAGICEHVAELRSKVIVLWVGPAAATGAATANITTDAIVARTRTCLVIFVTPSSNAPPAQVSGRRTGTIRSYQRT